MMSVEIGTIFILFTTVYLVPTESIGHMVKCSVNVLGMN